MSQLLTAARRVQAWYRQSRLPPPTHAIYTRGCPALWLWRRTYLARYPDEHVCALVDLIPRKLKRVELAACDGGGLPPRRVLQQQLACMSAGDLACVGW